MPPTIIFKEEGGYKTHVLTILNKGDDDGYYREFTLEEVTSWSGVSNEIIDKDILFEGTIKWDGCSHVNFGDEGGYLHLCGKRNWVALSTMLIWVYETVTRMIEHYDPRTGD